VTKALMGGEAESYLLVFQNKIIVYEYTNED
jgi:hypothetical protein